MIIIVDVSNKIAQVRDKTIVGVCGNSDYVVYFNFDTEWDAYETKTARFKWNGEYTDVVFNGNECPMPIIYDTNTLEIGVYAGELHTTTAAVLYMKKSVLCGNASESKESQELKDNMNKILAEKVDVPQTASVGDVLTVEEVDDNGKPTKWKAATKKQANWEQNDSTAEDYVQGRTHWVEHDVLTEILPETTFEVTLEDGNTQWWSDELNFSELWAVGDKAVVTVNGTEYNLTVYNLNDCLSVGNAYIVDDSYENTGEPFFMGIYEWNEGYQLGDICFNASGTYTISIKAYQDIYHAINPKYIPKVSSAIIEDRVRDISQIDIVAVATSWKGQAPALETDILTRPLLCRIVSDSVSEKVMVSAIQLYGKDGDDYGLHNIYSCKTGQLLTADECPYGVMFLAHLGFTDNYVCINPI